VLVLLAGALGILMLSAGSAAASPPLTFATLGEGAGQVNDPFNVAVDQSSGDVYVADYNNARVDKFSASGDFLMAWGYGVANGKTLALQTCGPEASPSTVTCFVAEGALTATGPGSVDPVSIAVDPSTGDVYVGDSHFRVDKFSASGQFLLMFGKGVDTTAGTAHPNLCTAANLAAGDTCGAGATGTAAGQFSQSSNRPIAIGSSGEVWVGDKNRLEQFNSSGEYVSEVPLAGAGETTALALNSSGDFYVKSASLAGVRKLEPSGTLIETLDAAGHPKALGLDPATGVVFISDQATLTTLTATLLEYSPAGVQTEVFATGQVIGKPETNALAVGDTANALYVVSRASGTASAAQLFSVPAPGPLVENQHAVVAPTTARLVASLNPEGHATSYRFEYGASDSYGQSTTTSTLPGSAFAEESIEASLSGLVPATTYHFRVVASSHCNASEPAEECVTHGEDIAFTTQPAVGIEPEWATGVASTEAVFNAELNSLDVPATWWVEYGPTAAYGSSTPETSLAAGSSAVPVSADAEALEPDTGYHYRFVARDVRNGVTYTTYGADETFTTQLAGMPFELPDGRAWELVSPPEKGGSLIEPIFEDTIQAAEDGDAITYGANAPIGSGVEGNRAPEWPQILSTRVNGAWSSQDIETRDFAEPAGGLSYAEAGAPSEYVLFSNDLTMGLVEPRGDTPLSPDASERTLYLRDDDAAPGEDPYAPLVSSKEGHANVPAGTVFGGNPDEPYSALEVVAATPDLSHVVLGSKVPLVAGGTPNGLYEWAAGTLTPVTVLPAAEGGTAVEWKEPEGNIGMARHVISNDGSRVVWSAGNHLYMRDTERGETVRLDVVQAGASGRGSGVAVFQLASADGSKVFFTDPQQLTADSTASGSGLDLYVFEVTSAKDEPLAGRLSDLTVDPNVNETANVQGASKGIVLGASEEGSSVYLVAQGVLSDTENGDGEKAVPGGDNLYLLSESGTQWTTRFVARLSSEDESDWHANVGTSEDLGKITSRVSPNGRYLAFMSDRSLTGYDNVDANSGHPDEEVFLYDADTERLVCASCDPTGARPVGVLDSKEESLVDRLGIWRGRWIAANIPGWTQNLDFPNRAIYQSRYLSDGGRLFFDSSDALVPQDANGTQDVYEYEPAGVGGCAESSAALSAASGGCVSLISSGTSGEESAFLEASANGDDVFFLTSAQLSGQDTDAALDVYDAHVCEASSPCPSPLAVSPPACTTADSCRAAPSPQPGIFGAPPSATFSGTGNLAPPSPSALPKKVVKKTAKCKKGFVKNKKNKCVRKKAKKKAKRAKKSSKSSRGSKS
jgi:hypothetical protein